MLFTHYLFMKRVSVWVTMSVEGNILSDFFGANYPRELAFNYNWLPMAYLNLALQTAFIPNTKQVSTFFISNAGLGKTKYLEFLKRFDFIEYVFDITPTYIVEFLRDVEHNKKKFLVTPDYITFMGHNKKTIDLTQSYFRAMTEEGVSSVKSYGLEETFDYPVKAGIISGITVDKAVENTGRWKSDGFFSRLLPFSYSHTLQTQTSILESFYLKKEIIDNLKITVNRTPIEPSWNNDIDNEIKLTAMSMSDEYKGAVYRRYKQVLALCKASAVVRNSSTIEKQDIFLIQTISNYLNRKQNPI